MCASEPVVINAITPRWDVEPESAHFLLRTTTAAAEGQTRSTFISALGGAPEFAEPYGDDLGLSGTFRDAAGATVSQDCATDGPDGPFQELVLVVASGPEGSDLRRMDVTYRAVGGSETHTVELTTYRTVTCGTSVPRRLC